MKETERLPRKKIAYKNIINQEMKERKEESVYIIIKKYQIKTDCLYEPTRLL